MARTDDPDSPNRASLPEDVHLGLLDQAPVAMVVTDKEGVVAIWNSAAEQVFGVSRREIVGRRFAQVFTDVESRRKLAELISAAVDEDTEVEVAEAVGADGEAFTVRLRAAALRNRSGACVGAICAALPLGAAAPSVPATDAAAEFGARIALARKAAGLTQRQLAELLGVTRRSVQGYEAGSVAPYRHLASISQALGRPPAWFLPDQPRAGATPPHRELRRLIQEEIENAFGARELPGDGGSAGTRRPH